MADEGLGFGHPADGGDALDAPGVTPAMRRLVAALREESRADVKDAATVAEFLEDAANLETRYRQMLATLEQQGVAVVRFGRDNHAPVEEVFAAVGMKVLGPTQDHLLICAEAIARLTQDALTAVSDLTDDDLETVDEVALYRSLAGRSFSDAADMPGKGAALNDQSLVLRFAVGGRKVLLTGDMQFAKAEVSGLGELMTALRGTVEADGPFDFVKIAHHASYNALDASVLAEIADTRVFAMSGGIDDSTHPDPDVLRLLRRNRPRIQWARTDRNGLITVSLGASGVRLRTSRGELNDATANTDVAPPPPVVSPGLPAAPAAVLPQPTMVPPAPAVVQRVEAGDDRVVEVIARVPHTATRVTLTIDVQPQESAAGIPERPAPVRQPPPAPRRADGTLPELRIGGGRTLPPLLFVTSAQALARNIGQAEAAHLLAALRQAGQTVFDGLPAGAADATQAAARVRERVESRHHGVVLLGGYDVVPSLRLDALDPGLRGRLPASHGDSDDFIVWSDDVYGNVQGDSFPELPVSRIPDGLAADLVFAAVQAEGGGRARRFGLRNRQRPFAQEIFQTVAGQESLLVCETTQPADLDSAALDADAVYLMLHGADTDGSRFWGEDDAGTLEAINIGNIPAHSPAVVFTGCCWGALCVDKPAALTDPGRSPAPRTPPASMALSFLRAGALAFVGCTGSHYSPIIGPFNYFGAPMHKAFWQRFREGAAPAEALLKAKHDYLEGMPHGRTSPQGQAIERKILWQYTSLGLGW